MDVATWVAIIVSVFSAGIAGYSWWKTHTLTEKIAHRDEIWRSEDLERQANDREPHIVVEQTITTESPPGADNDLYLRTIAKNLGQVDVILKDMAAIELAVIESGNDQYMWIEPSLLISQGVDPNWSSPQTFPLRLGPNEICTTYIGLNAISEHINMMNLTTEQGNFIGYMGIYQDQVGRTFRPNRAVTHWDRSQGSKESGHRKSSILES